MDANKELLKNIEQEIRKQAEVVKGFDTKFRKAKDILQELVYRYDGEREKIQRSLWAERKLGWCQSCDKFYPEKKIRLLYLETNYKRHEKHIKSVCPTCLQRYLSSPRRQDGIIQCFEAKKENNTFNVFVEGSWAALPKEKLSEIKIEIQKSWISEEEYCSCQNGKLIRYSNYPNLSLTIDKEKIID